MKLAIFDFDGTLFPHETLPFLLKQWKIQKYSKARLYHIYMMIGGMYIWYKLGFGKKHREYMRRTALQKFTRIFTGMTNTQVNLFFEACAKQVVKEFNDSVVREIKKAKSEGFHTVILSGCYSDLFMYINRDLGVDTIIGTALYFKDGFIDAKKELSVCIGSGKAKKIKEIFAGKDVDYKNSTAYADSVSDLSIFELVENPVAVYPDEELAKIAAEKNWRIIK